MITVIYKYLKCSPVLLSRVVIKLSMYSFCSEVKYSTQFPISPFLMKFFMPGKLSLFSMLVYGFFCMFLNVVLSTTDLTTSSSGVMPRNVQMVWIDDVISVFMSSYFSRSTLSLTAILDQPST